MSWFDHQDDIRVGSNKQEENKLKTVLIKLPGGTEFLKVNKNCVKRIYADDLGGPVVIIVDEVAELLQPTGVKSEAGKEEDNMKTEIMMIIQSITQLGRSSGIHCVLCTQRNGTQILNGTIQSNCIAEGTEIEKRE